MDKDTFSITWKGKSPTWNKVWHDILPKIIESYKASKPRRIVDFQFPDWAYEKLVKPYAYAPVIEKEGVTLVKLSPICFCLYWEPSGDEAVVYMLFADGDIAGGDTDWITFLDLEKINPAMRNAKIGSSDFEAIEYLVFYGYTYQKCFIIHRRLWELLKTLIRTRPKSRTPMEVIEKFFEVLEKHCEKVRQFSNKLLFKWNNWVKK